MFKWSCNSSTYGYEGGDSWWVCYHHLHDPPLRPNQTWKQISRAGNFDIPASERLREALLLGVVVSQSVTAWESVGGQSMYFGSTDQRES